MTLWKIDVETAVGRWLADVGYGHHACKKHWTGEAFSYRSRFSFVLQLRETQDDVFGVERSSDPWGHAFSVAITWEPRHAIVFRYEDGGGNFVFSIFWTSSFIVHHFEHEMLVTARMFRHCALGKLLFSEAFIVNATEKDRMSFPDKELCTTILLLLAFFSDPGRGCCTTIHGTPPHWPIKTVDNTKLKRRMLGRVPSGLKTGSIFRLRGGHPVVVMQKLRWSGFSPQNAP